MVVEYSLLLVLWSSSLDSSLVSNMASLLVLSLPFLYKASIGDLKSSNRICFRPSVSPRPSVSLESSQVVGVVVKAVLFSSALINLVSTLVNLSMVNPNGLVYPCLVKSLLSKIFRRPQVLPQDLTTFPNFLSQPW